MQYATSRIYTTRTKGTPQGTLSKIRHKGTPLSSSIANGQGYSHKWRNPSNEQEDRQKESHLLKESGHSNAVTHRSLKDEHRGMKTINDITHTSITMSSVPSTSTNTTTRKVASSNPTFFQDAARGENRTPLSHDAERITEETRTTHCHYGEQDIVEEHPAVAEEPQLGPLVTTEDWDRVHDACLEEAGYVSSPPTSLENVAQLIQVRDAALLRNASLLFEGADNIILAKDLLTLKDFKLMKELKKCQRSQQTPFIAKRIATTDNQEKVRLITRIQRLYGRWPEGIIFVQDEMTTPALATTIEDCDILEGIQSVSSTDSQELRKAQMTALDAAYNLLSYGQQVVHNVETSTTLQQESLEHVARVMKHALEGIDLARDIDKTWQRISPSSSTASPHMKPKEERPHRQRYRQTKLWSHRNQSSSSSTTGRFMPGQQSNVIDLTKEDSDDENITAIPSLTKQERPLTPVTPYRVALDPSGLQRHPSSLIVPMIERVKTPDAEAQEYLGIKLFPSIRK